MERNNSGFINNNNQNNLKYNNSNINLVTNMSIVGEKTININTINESIINPNESQMTIKGIFNSSFGN